MEQVNLKAELKDTTGKEKCKKIRQAGFIPAVIYGKDMENVMIQVSVKDFQKLISTESGTRVIVNLDVQGTPYTTTILEIQKDVFQKEFYHIDFHKISLDENLKTIVPVQLTGDSKGVKSGGILEHHIHKVRVEGLPLEIPDKLILDISGLDQGEHIAIKDIKISDKVKILENPQGVVVIIQAPKIVAEAEKEPAISGSKKK